jgi:hypothetical protein
MSQRNRVPLVLTQKSSVRAILITFCVSVSVFFLPLHGLAWEVNTHEQLTEKAIEKVAPHLNAYLVDQLGLEGGLNAPLPGGTPIALMKEGSNMEDAPPRFFSHFHDPLSNSGLGKIMPSAVDWSLFPEGRQMIWGSWSWNDAREYYFKALASPTKAERDEYWAKTFKALGHIMHLIQDSANPAHVRNDPHPFDEGLHDYMARQHVGSYTGSGSFTPEPSMLEQAGATRPEPFSNLFDRNIYSGNNPGSTLGGHVGVTEFTNANFFSDDTVPGQGNTAFIHPSLSELVPATAVPFGPQYLTLPRLGSTSDLKARVAKYTGNRALATFKLGKGQLDFLDQFRLDDLVYEAYSRNLIPRAVGYSAAVLNYFFRGTLTEESSRYEICSHPWGQVEEWGWLEVKFSLQPGLSLEGIGAFYYDLPDGTRVLSGEGPVSSTNIYFWAGDFIPYYKFSFNQPITWTIIFQGEMGPGAKEPRTVMGLTGKARWYDPGCPI